MCLSWYVEGPGMQGFHETSRDVHDDCLCFWRSDGNSSSLQLMVCRVLELSSC